jgi:SNF2 family DNA or RNA helicase
MKYRFQTKPYAHQRRALVFLLKNKGGGLQVPMRYGKTKVGVDFAAAMYLKEEVRRVLVVTVTSGLGVWEDEIGIHCPVPWRTYDWHGEELAHHKQSNPSSLQFMLVNFANVYDRAKTGGRSWSPVQRESLRKFKPQIVIVDESHHIGNPTSAQFIMTNLLGREADFRVIMTGTMFHRKPFFVFGQMKFLDHGRSLGSEYGHFKKRIAVMGGHGNYQVMRYKNLKWMMKQVKKQVLIEKPKKGLPPAETKVPFRLQGANLKAYQKMEKDKVLVVDGEAVMSPLVITRHLRLHMIEGGWIRLESGKYKRVGTDKMDIAEDRLAEHLAQGTEKLVIACRFIPELADMARVAKRLGAKPLLFHGALKKRERQERINSFNTHKGPAFFISQIATGSQAINLSVADTMIFYSLSESYLLHDQMSQRIAKYKDTRTLQYDYIVGRGTRGEVTYQAIKQKRDVADFIVENPRLVEKITRIREPEAAW